MPTRRSAIRRCPSAQAANLTIEALADRAFGADACRPRQPWGSRRELADRAECKRRAAPVDVGTALIAATAEHERPERTSRQLAAHVTGELG